MNNKHCLADFIACFFIVSLLLAKPAVAAPDIAHEPLASIHESLLTVHQNNAELADVLFAVAQQAGFAVTVYGELGQTQTPGQIVDMPLEQGVRALLDKVNFMLVYDSAFTERRISAVRVFGSGSTKSTATRHASPPEHQPVHQSAPTDSADSMIQRELLQALQEPDLASRLSALNQLYQLPDPEALTVLAQVLQQDADYQVRARSVELLAAMDSAAAIDVLQTGLGDADARLRIDTINMLGFVAGERAVPLLGQVLFNEADRNVRAQAVATLAMQPRSEAVDGFLQVAVQDRDRSIREFAMINLMAAN
ncbi:MAG: HEAT repeat domain-containing protein [Gammaproteobacteria bacterium]